MISKNQIKFIRALEHKKFRRQEGLFVAEGPKVVGDMLRAGWKSRLILYTNASFLPKESHALNMQEVSLEELKRISFLQHPQDVLAVFEQKAPVKRFSSIATRLSLALDNIQDPGNLGTIIRIADWFGIEDIYCSLDTADAYSPKVVQATMGSLARVNIVYTDLKELICSLAKEVPVYGTLLDGGSIYEQSLTSHGLIVMGNEGNGISPDIRQLITHRLLIPSYPQGRPTAESLNVAIATAIVCTEFRRRRL